MFRGSGSFGAKITLDPPEKILKLHFVCQNQRCFAFSMKVGYQFTHMVFCLPAIF